jgi:hypothetical protein
MIPVRPLVLLLTLRQEKLEKTLHYDRPPTLSLDSTPLSLDDKVVPLEVSDHVLVV